VCGQVARENRPIFFFKKKWGRSPMITRPFPFKKVKSLDEWITQQARNTFFSLQAYYAKH
jgi:hypothetical protein